MSFVHLVYNKGPRLKTPERITHELAERLGRRYSLQTYDPNEVGTVQPEPGDILIGHPSRYGRAGIFERSFERAGWAKRIVFCPFSHEMPLDAAMIDPLVERADRYLALCGPYWYDTAPRSLVSHWTHKMMRCDLGVNRDDYPVVKGAFNPSGKRRFVYIGNAGPMKGVDFFCRLAEANPQLQFGWIGWIGDHMRPPGTRLSVYRALEKRLQGPNITVHDGQDWRARRAVEIASTYDFLVTCGRSDSNPTTILESASWGLLPVATAQCGYYPEDWLVPIPLDDVAGASLVLQHLNDCPESELVSRREACFRKLDGYFTWDHAAEQVVECIEAKTPVEPDDPAWRERKRRNQRRLRAMRRRYRIEQLLETMRARARRLGKRVFRKVSPGLPSPPA